MRVFSNRNIQLLRISLLFAISAVLQTEQFAASQELKSFDHRIQLESQALEHYLQYPNSKLGNFYKISVNVTDGEGNSPVHYEDLYLSSKIGDKPALVGCRRYVALPIKEKKQVVFEMKFSDKSPKDEQVSTSAYAVPPLLVELLQNDDTAGVVSVPEAYFYTFNQSLNSQGFQPAAQVRSEQTGLVNLALQSEPLGKHEPMLYFPSLKKK